MLYDCIVQEAMPALCESLEIRVFARANTKQLCAPANFFLKVCITSMTTTKKQSPDSDIFPAKKPAVIATSPESVIISEILI